MLHRLDMAYGMALSWALLPVGLGWVVCMSYDSHAVCRTTHHAPVLQCTRSCRTVDILALISRILVASCVVQDMIVKWMHSVLCFGMHGMHEYHDPHDTPLRVWREQHAP